jgi:hypothetical protein
MVQQDLTQRRQALVGVRREIVPDVVVDRIGGQRGAGIGLQQCYRHPQIGGQKIILQEIVL